jgi:hypothetical protein
MRKKSGITIVEQAIVLVPEFENVVRKLEQQVTLRGQSKSTLHNYIRRIALFVVHFGMLPEQIDSEEINEYLAALARARGCPPGAVSNTWSADCCANFTPAIC